MFHRAVKRTAMFHRRCGAGGVSLNHEGFDVPLAPLRSLTAKADCCFCNLECPLVKAPAGDPYCMKTPGPFWFKAPAVAAGAVRWAGFDVLSIANNHIDNAGPAGMASTNRILQDAGLLPVGAGPDFDTAHEPVVFRAGSLDMAFVAYCSSRLGRDINVSDPSKPHVCRCRPGGDGCEQLWRDLARARRQGRFVILSFHWGPGEYTWQPDPSIVSFARTCADRGADIIAGHHPHVLHRIERYKASDGRRCLIMYSLGNLLSNQSPRYAPLDPTHDENRARRREGAAVIVDLHMDGRGGRPRIGKVGFEALWTENNWRDYRSGLEPARVRVLPVKSEIRRLRAMADFLEERLARTKKALAGTLTPRSSAGDLGAGISPVVKKTDAQTPGHVQ